MINIKSTLKNIKDNDLYRVRKVISSAQDTNVVIDKKKYINFSTNAKLLQCSTINQNPLKWILFDTDTWTHATQ